MTKIIIILLFWETVPSEMSKISLSPVLLVTDSGNLQSAEQEYIIRGIA